MKKIILGIVIFLLLCSSMLLFSITENSKELKVKLFFSSQQNNKDYSFSAPRNFTFDEKGNYYIFDYSTNEIKKYTREGKFVLTIGKKGKGEGEFRHLTAIKVYKDILYALDSVALFKFNLSGKLLKIQKFKNKVTCDHPVIDPHGGFVGSWISSENMMRILTLRDPAGNEILKLSKYRLTEFYPELKKSKDFFLNSLGDREYLYAVEADESVIWAATDRLKIYRYKNNKSKMIINTLLSPIKFPETERVKLTEKKTKLKKYFPSLHMHIPKVYNLLYHLFIDQNRNIWIYVKSKDFTGFKVFSSKGSFLNDYKIDSTLEVKSTVLQVYKNTLYIMKSNRKKMEIYLCELPAIKS